MRYSHLAPVFALAVVAFSVTILSQISPVVLLAAPASPAPSAASSPYFPVAVGNQWVYSWTNSVYATSPIRETSVITEVQGDISRFRVFNDRGVNGTYQLSTTAGLEWVGYNTGGWNPFPLPLHQVYKYLFVPRNMLPGSFAAGDSWTGTGWYAGTVYTGTTTAVAITATVSANGRVFTDCLLLHTVITGPVAFGSGERDAWFAPDVGLVRLVYDHDDGSLTTADLLMGPRVYGAFLPLTVRNQ